MVAVAPAVTAPSPIVISTSSAAAAIASVELIVILRNTISVGTYSDSSSGIVTVADGFTGTSTSDFVPDTTTVYYYKIFVKDVAGNWSSGIERTATGKEQPNNAPVLDSASATFIISGGVNADTDIANDGGDDFDGDNEPLTYTCHFDTSQDSNVAVSAATECTDVNIANGSGFSFSSTTGVISGWDPSTVQAYEFRIQACDNNSSQLCDTIFVNVNVVDRTLGISSVSVAGEHGVATMLVTMSQASASDVTFEYYTTDGTATNGNDYSSVEIAIKLTISAGETALTAPIVLFNDLDDETNESINLYVQNVTGAGAGLLASSFVITDDDYGNLVDVQQGSAAESHSCVVRENGAVSCWGSNGSGQLGNGSTSSGVFTFVDVAGLSGGVKQVEAGMSSYGDPVGHSCALFPQEQ